MKEVLCILKTEALSLLNQVTGSNKLSLGNWALNFAQWNQLT